MVLEALELFLEMPGHVSIHVCENMFDTSSWFLLRSFDGLYDVLPHFVPEFLLMFFGDKTSINEDFFESRNRFSSRFHPLLQLS